MAVTISITLRSHSLASLRTRPADIGLTDLTYRFPLGDVVIKAGDVEFPMTRVTVFDFARAMLVAFAQARESGTAEYDFTEGEGSIFLRVDGSALRVDCDFADGFVESTVDEFQESLVGAGLSLVGQLRQSFPGILENSHVKALASALESAGR
ncbi:hypothetical protein [Kitasatospora mediocidica]|uniref:hypothetical protein n=1 Tax=Kitasatospora mediocidica TaxID=58352 RepID=UPI00055AE2AD|nr:hypothetical protein [Kitasatospora mediocidica]